jgi:DNA repair exonuclease SbcCD nuclease subunit
LENLIAYTVECKADALLLAGDVYDGNWRDYATGRFFVEQMGILHDANIPVFMIAGNHDAESEITLSLRLPPNVTRLKTDEPDRVPVDDLGLVVHGQGFATRAVHHNLVRAYRDPIPGMVNVGLLHTALEGAEGHDTYAPCTPDDLFRVGYDYFALGHVHAQRVFYDDGHPKAAFSGNLQGRHPRETGAKGALVVDVEPGQPVQLNHQPMDVARWATLDLDVTGCDDFGAVLDLVEARLRDERAQAEQRHLVARVNLGGTTKAAAVLADGEKLREEMEAVAGRCGVALEKVGARVSSPGRPESLDPELVAAVSVAAEELMADAAGLSAKVKSLDAEFGRVLRGAALLDLKNPDTLADLARRAGEELAARLGGQGRRDDGLPAPGVPAGSAPPASQELRDAGSRATRDAGFPGDPGPADREAIRGARTREAVDGVLMAGEPIREGREGREAHVPGSQAAGGR